MCVCVRDRKEVRGASQKRSGKMGALLGSMVIQRVLWLKGGVRKEVHEPVARERVDSYSPARPAAWGRGARAASVCVCASCAYVCPGRVGTWEGRSPSRKEVIDSAWPRTHRFWLIFRRQGPGEYGRPALLVSQWRRLSSLASALPPALPFPRPQTTSTETRTRTRTLARRPQSGLPGSRRGLGPGHAQQVHLGSGAHPWGPGPQGRFPM